MKKKPAAVFVVDTTREEIAVNEAVKLGIPIVGTIDTNSDPDKIDFGIPINDDAIRSVELVVEFIAEAVLAGTGAAGMEAQAAEAKKAEEKEEAKKLVEAEAKTIEEVLAEQKTEDSAEATEEEK